MQPKNERVTFHLRMADMQKEVKRLRQDFDTELHRVTALMIFLNSSLTMSSNSLSYSFWKEQLAVTDDAGERCCSFCYTNESALPNGLKMCNGCYVAMYCSPQCQRRDWRRGPHRHLCRRIQKLNEAQNENCPPLLHLSSSDTEWEFFQKNNQKKLV